MSKISAGTATLPDALDSEDRSTISTLCCGTGPGRPSRQNQAHEERRKAPADNETGGS